MQAADDAHNEPESDKSKDEQRKQDKERMHGRGKTLKRKRDKTSKGTKRDKKKKKKNEHSGSSDEEEHAAAKDAKETPAEDDAKATRSGSRVDWSSDGSKKTAEVVSVQGNEYKALVTEEKIRLYHIHNGMTGTGSDDEDYVPTVTSCGECLKMETVCVGVDFYLAISTSDTPQTSPIVMEGCVFTGFYTYTGRKALRESLGSWKPLPGCPTEGDSGLFTVAGA